MAQQNPKAGTGSGDGIDIDETFSGLVTGRASGDFTAVKPYNTSDVTGTYLGKGTVGQINVSLRAGVSACDHCKGKTVKVGMWAAELPSPTGGGVVVGPNGDSLFFGVVAAMGIKNGPGHVVSQVATADMLEIGAQTWKDVSLPKMDGYVEWPGRVQFSFDNDSVVMVDFAGLFMANDNKAVTQLFFGKLAGQKNVGVRITPGQTAVKTESFLAVFQCNCDPAETTPVAFIEWTKKVTITLGNTAQTTTGLATLVSATIVCPTDPGYPADLAIYNNALKIANGKGNPEDRFAGTSLYTPQ
jgi:hypothetical protein